MLKEEIRKFQRSEERKKHIENSEYVKNILLKVSLHYRKKFLCHAALLIMNACSSPLTVACLANFTVT